MTQQFIITRFSYRGTNLSARKGIDPLNEKNLEHRFDMFEISCLPAVLNQENQDFTWVLIVDEMLPKNYRERLLKLISKRPDSHIVNFSPDLGIPRLAWLRPWLKPETNYVVTTKLDDDDLIFSGYTHYISEVLNQNESKEPMMFFACKNDLYWDFYYSKKAPFGFLKKINRYNFPPAAGFALCCKYPEINLSIESFEHTTFNYIANVNAEIKSHLKSKIKNRLDLIFHEASKSNLGWDGMITEKNIHIISYDSIQAITINHLDNIQFGRLFLNNKRRVPVNPELFLQGFDIDFDKVGKQIVKYRKSFRTLLLILKNHFGSTPHSLIKAHVFKKMQFRCYELRKIIAGFLKL